MNQFALNLIQGSVRINFTPEAAQNLQRELSTLMQSLKAVAITTGERGQRPQPQATMEYRYTGDVFLEVFCNPNIYPSPFAAKVLLTIRDDKIRLTTEAELTQLLEDIDRYLENN
ncbi:conserved hypothetical protein [Hyella patelloides LEGE 07179]|uniref:Uncharacterized protein n=1 Tax=Hyella patelloides LEGE 07179 TaxID=945734 RepID=A0A563W494_9CYAN|nr:hypothetical protein [Hyella patelloides]VEP18508.1 conserved hypothetical protein [Hyella patelloides LEGE 07179]